MPTETPEPQPALQPPELRYRRRRNHLDGTGTVRIKVSLVERCSFEVKGNMTRSYSIPHTKVSAVCAQIDRLMAEGQLPASGTLRRSRSKRKVIL